MIHLHLHTSRRFLIMDATHYWPFAREYSIWNIPYAALQFWMADLDPQTLSNAIEWVYTTFFCSNSTHHLRIIPEEILFSHFVTTLNNTFEWELALEDGGYKSGSESLSIPTLLCRAPCLYHISASDNLSFRPVTPQAHSPQWPGNLNAMHCHLMFEEDDDSSIDSNPLHGSTEQSSLTEHPMACHLTSSDEEEEEEVEEEHFPNSSIEWWHLDGRTSSRQALMHPWTFTTWPVPLPLPIQFGSATPHSRICINTSVHRPQWYLQLPRCDNNHQPWRYT